MKHLKHAYETLTATLDLLLKYANENTCNIRTETIETYV
jgi:effector-binding domain-containing protein